MHQTKKHPWYFPDEYAPNLAAIDPVILYKRGIRACIFDFDNTLITDKESVIRNDIQEILKKWSQVFGPKRITIVSNKILRNDFERLHTRTKELGIPAVGTGILLKPLPLALLRAAANMQTPPQQTVIIGDLLLADILGGKFAGMHTILIQPLSKHERFISHLFRPLERFLLKGTDFYTAA